MRTMMALAAAAVAAAVVAPVTTETDPDVLPLN